MKRGNRDIIAITDARLSRAENLQYRRRRYLLAMTCRVLCFVAMVAVPASLEVKALFAAAAIFLPYIAVVLANSYDSRRLGQDATGFVAPSGTSLPPA